MCKMGQLALYDWLHGHLSNEEFDLFSYDDIDAVYERVEQLKYNQTVSRTFNTKFELFFLRPCCEEITDFKSQPCQQDTYWEDPFGGSRKWVMKRSFMLLTSTTRKSDT